MRRVADAARTSGIEHELLDLLREQLHGLLHDVFTIIDGGTALAERFRVYVADEDGNIFGDDDLHERFVDHLFDTDRAQ